MIRIKDEKVICQTTLRHSFTKSVEAPKLEVKLAPKKVAPKKGMGKF